MWPRSGMLGTRRTQTKSCPGIEFWEVEEHEVAYRWLRAFKIWPGNCVLGNPTARSGLQLAPSIQNVAR
eukprot:8879104-Pyramimonas_sp.AAC.1